MWVIALGCDKTKHRHIVTVFQCHEIRDPLPIGRRLLFLSVPRYSTKKRGPLKFGNRLGYSWHGRRQG